MVETANTVVLGRRVVVVEEVSLAVAREGVVLLFVTDVTMVVLEVVAVDGVVVNFRAVGVTCVVAELQRPQLNRQLVSMNSASAKLPSQ